MLRLGQPFLFLALLSSVKKKKYNKVNNQINGNPYHQRKTPDIQSSQVRYALRTGIVIIHYQIDLRLFDRNVALRYGYSR